MPTEQRKLLIMIMMRSKRPFQMTAGNFVVLSYVNFNAVSIFSVKTKADLLNRHEILFDSISGVTRIVVVFYATTVYAVRTPGVMNDT